ncbi:MAG: MOMP family protein [Simkaniaceae bacterium]|nr:MAG: MOMP family protein [Simkaniaceae bacterium]
MKVFSLLSTAVVTTCLAASGFCEDVRISQNENMVLEDSISHRTNGTSNDYQNQNQTYGASGQSKNMDDPNRETHSVHGCMSGFSIGAEFLWWRAQMDNLQYASQAGLPPGAALPVVFSGRIKEPDFEFDPGVRVSAGYDFGRDNWDVFLRWTYQNTDVSDSTGTSSVLSVLPLKDFSQGQGILAVSVADTAKVKWQNKLNVFDFEMGYDYFLSQRCSLRPFFGVKAAWLDMDYQTDYTNVLFNGGDTRHVGISSKTDYWGVGPMVGVDGYLHIGWGFSLYSQTSAALVYGQYDANYRQTDTTGDLFRERSDNYARQRAVGIIGVGLEWAYCFSGKYMLAFNLGWEGQYWWNQYELIFFDDTSFHGDLTYSGLDAGLRFDF